MKERKEKVENPRSLEAICGGFEFNLMLHDLTYCGLKPSSDNLLCRYRNQTKDHNGLHTCLYIERSSMGY